MLDIRLFREDLDGVKRRLARRAVEVAVCDEIVEIDRTRRETIAAVEEKKAERNAASKEIGLLKKEGKPADEKMAAVRLLGEKIAELDQFVRDADARIEEKLLGIPNLPDERIPDTENTVVKTVGSLREHDEPHWDIGPRLALVDFERGVKISGARFYALTGVGARLERALIAFMLDLQFGHGYTEIIPPYLVSSESMRGTGQFPKFRDEAFGCVDDDLVLIPTAEVPVTNFHRDEILESLPIKYVSATPCFRREAGSYGQDTRGLIRVHQFHKVEVVQFVSPDESEAAHEELTRHAEAVLEALELSYRRVLLAANDIGFSAARTYDLEVWMPGMKRYAEISSCSNFTDYQARRMKIRFRRDAKAKPELVHTLNGSALAVGRTFAAVLENGLQDDGSVVIPKALRPYLGGMERIRTR